MRTARHTIARHTVTRKDRWLEDHKQDHRCQGCTIQGEQNLGEIRVEQDHCSERTMEDVML